jgi:hypothetical protein
MQRQLNDIAIVKVYVSYVQDALEGIFSGKNLWEPLKTFPKIQCRGDLCGRRSRCYRWGLRHQLADTVGQLGSIANPIVNAVALQIDGCWVRAGIIGAHNFNRPAITGAILFNYNDAVVGLLARSNARQTNHQH